MNNPVSRRYVVVWNNPETPIAQVIDIGDQQEATRIVLDLLIHGWNWTSEELSERNENVHVFEVTDETQTDPRVIGTVALFRNNGELDRIFTDLVPIYKGETVKQALIERVTPELSDCITFKIPNELLNRTHGWEGTPLLTKVSGVDNIVTTIIGFVLFIDRGLAKALETFDLNRFWLNEPMDGFIWPARVAEDFSAHIQALCEDHSIDAPCPLE